MRDTTAYLIGGERFNYCADCVDEHGTQGEQMSKCQLDKEWCDWCSVESICCIESLCDVCKEEGESK